MKESRKYPTEFNAWGFVKEIKKRVEMIENELYSDCPLCNPDPGY